MPVPDQLASHASRFLAMLDDAFRRHGCPDGLPPALRDAVAATLRHMFVHRFRLRAPPGPDQVDPGPPHDQDADPAAHLATIYSDAVMTHVDATGATLPSTNSVPSYVLWLLHLLELRPGQRVLEIGSGSGWLVAVMARLVGKAGHVTGIEIIPALAARSRADLRRLGIRNATVIAADGAGGCPAGIPFDRVVITAATWDLPIVLFDQVVENGLVLAPIELRSGSCQVTVLRREGDRFVGDLAMPGWFVPLVGPDQRRSPSRIMLEALPFWNEIGASPARRMLFPLLTGSDGAWSGAAAAFSAFLGRSEPDFALIGAATSPRTSPSTHADAFGIVHREARSVGLWHRGEMVGYGGPEALRTLLHAYDAWTALGLPGLAGFGLDLIRTGTGCPVGSRSWIEQRLRTTLVWRAQKGSDGWHDLLRDA